MSHARTSSCNLNVQCLLLITVYHYCCCCHCRCYQLLFLFLEFVGVSAADVIPPWFLTVSPLIRSTVVDVHSDVVFCSCYCNYC